MKTTSTSPSPPVSITAPPEKTGGELGGSQEGATTPAGNPAADIDRWIEKINADLGYSIGWAVQAGADLMVAKQQLGHGHWLAMFGAGKLAFGLRKGQMLMEIAQHPSLRKTQNFAHLPVAWTALHALTKVQATILDARIADGAVHQQLTLAAARQLAAGHASIASTAQTEGRTDSFDPSVRQTRLLAYLRREAAGWPPQTRPLLARVLQEFAVGLARISADTVPERPPAAASGLDQPDFTKQSHQPHDMKGPASPIDNL